MTIDSDKLRRFWSSGTESTQIHRTTVGTSVRSSVESRTKDHAEIDSQIERFLASGGEITKVPPGESALGRNGRPADQHIVIDYRTVDTKKRQENKRAKNNLKRKR